jgi:hypothetical protein
MKHLLSLLHTLSSMSWTYQKGSTGPAIWEGYDIGTSEQTHTQKSKYIDK